MFHFMHLFRFKAIKVPSKGTFQRLYALPAQ